MQGQETYENIALQSLESRGQELVLRSVFCQVLLFFLHFDHSCEGGGDIDLTGRRGTVSRVESVNQAREWLESATRS